MSLGRIVANVVSMLRARRRQGAAAAGGTRGRPAGVAGDAKRLQQALLNYAVNAVKFTEAGSVTLRTSCLSEEVDSVLVRFEVQDTGIGIAAETLPRLFCAFEQADSSTTRSHGGSGLAH
ncbi:MAG: hypothetical protein IPP44_12680 [Ideonella sp.]|nr:hypothetical protein [Ideonella sp.]